MKRYKLYVHIKPIVHTAPDGRGQIVMQQEENQIYKRYGDTEEAAKEELKTFLLKYYYNDWEIYQCEEDKTHTIGE